MIKRTVQLFRVQLHEIIVEAYNSDTWETRECLSFCMILQTSDSTWSALNQNLILEFVIGVLLKDRLFLRRFCKSSIKKERWWPIIGSRFLDAECFLQQRWSNNFGLVTWLLIIRPLSHAHSLNSPGSLSRNLGTFDLSSIESIPRMARRKIKRLRRKWAAHNF